MELRTCRTPTLRATHDVRLNKPTDEVRMAWMVENAVVEDRGMVLRLRFGAIDLDPWFSVNDPARLTCSPSLPRGFLGARTYGSNRDT